MNEPKFLADCMLGKLARWLAMLGYDSCFASGGGPDSDLLERASREGRIFLTRDTRIPPVKGLRQIIIKEQRFEDQLKKVLQETGLRPDRARFFTRCTLCNLPLNRLDRAEALTLVPPKARELATDFFRCPGCGHMYWSGTHVENAVKKLRLMGLV